MTPKYYRLLRVFLNFFLTSKIFWNNKTHVRKFLCVVLEHNQNDQFCPKTTKQYFVSCMNDVHQ